MEYTSIQKLYDIYLQNSSISIDSRFITAGCIFFAIKGQNFNGNEFADEAINKGARYAVVDDYSIKYQNTDKILLVDNSVDSLIKIAQLHRENIKVPVIAITGTAGKTTTKNLIAAILASKYKVIATKGNLNSDIGLPLTILQIKASHQIVVLEIGADKLGDIARKCSVAKPTHGLITSIGKAHMLSFGSLENIKKTKSELYNYLAKTSGIAFVNSSNDTLIQLSKGLENKIFYGNNEAKINYIHGQVELAKDKIRVKWKYLQHGNFESYIVDTQLTGSYNLLNCLAAISVAKYFNISDNQINKTLESYKPSDSRSELIHTTKNNTIINDSYNANPLSMSMALQSFSNIQVAKKIAVIGDMLELGKYSYHEHKNIIELARKLNIPKLVFVGEEFYNLKGEFVNISKFRFFKSLPDTTDYISNISDSYILIKASRGLHIENLLEYL